jgi:hypothetical protein
MCTFFSILNSYVCRIRHIIPKWNTLFKKGCVSAAVYNHQLGLFFAVAAATSADAHSNNNTATPAAKIIWTMKRTPTKKCKQDGNEDAESIAGREGQKTQKRTTGVKDPPAAGTNSTNDADDPQESGTNSTDGTSSHAACTNSTIDANNPKVSGANSTDGTINADMANTKNYDDDANAKKTGDAPPNVQQTTQSQRTTNSNESNTIESDSKHANDDAPGQKVDENVSYFVTF